MWCDGGGWKNAPSRSSTTIVDAKLSSQSLWSSSSPAAGGGGSSSTVAAGTSTQVEVNNIALVSSRVRARICLQSSVFLAESFATLLFSSPSWRGVVRLSLSPGPTILSAFHSYSRDHFLRLCSVCSVYLYLDFHPTQPRPFCRSRQQGNFVRFVNFSGLRIM